MMLIDRETERALANMFAGAELDAGDAAVIRAFAALLHVRERLFHQEAIALREHRRTCPVCRGDAPASPLPLSPEMPE